MKYTKMFLALIICVALSCSSKDDYVEPAPGTAGGGGSSVTLQTVQLTTLQTSTYSILNAMRSSPTSYLATENGVTFAKLENLPTVSGFNFTKNIRLLAPVPTANYPYDQIRAEISAQLNNMNVGSAFKSNLLKSFDYIRIINTQTFAQFETYFENKLQAISFPPNVAGLPPSMILSELEKFALTQAYYTVLNQARVIYNNPTPPAGGACLPQTREKWMEVAEEAFNDGLYAGVGLGVWGVYHGAVATTPAGAPVVGGIVGGALGFILGFTAGAVGGAAKKLLWHCIAAQLFLPALPFICNGKQVYAHATSLVGCIAGTLRPCADWSVCPRPSGINLRDVANLGLVPNKGRTALHTSVINDINWLFGYM